MTFHRYMAWAILSVALGTPAILSFGSSKQQAPADRPSRKAPPAPVWTNETEAFALGDDEIGESFTAFLSHHPKARCVDSTATTKSCYQWENISIYGMSAHSGPDCSPKNHASAGCVQGLAAQFKNQQLMLLSYAVEGSDKRNVVAALRVKYGAPGIDNIGATIWADGGDELSISVNKATEAGDGPTLVTVMIMRP